MIDSVYLPIGIPYWITEGTCSYIKNSKMIEYTKTVNNSWFVLYLVEK